MEVMRRRLERIGASTSRQSWQRMEPSLLKESATGIPQAAQSCLVRALEPSAESRETGDVVRIRIIPSNLHKSPSRR